MDKLSVDGLVVKKLNGISYFWGDGELREQFVIGQNVIGQIFSGQIVFGQIVSGQIVGL